MSFSVVEMIKDMLSGAYIIIYACFFLAPLFSILVLVEVVVVNRFPLRDLVSELSVTILSLNAMVVVPVTISLTNTASGSPPLDRCSLHRRQRP